MNLVQSFKNFINDEEGVTAIEYALLAAVIAVVVAAAAAALGGKITSLFTFIGGKLDDAATPAS